VKLFVSHVERKPEPEPVKVNQKLVVLIGTGVWVVVLLVLLAFYQSLADAGLLWWQTTDPIWLIRASASASVFALPSSRS